ETVTAPVWSPDSQRVLVHSMGKGVVEVTLASGASAALPSDPDAGPSDWSADGRFALAGNRNAISLLPLFGDRKPQILSNIRFTIESLLRFSPDSKYVAYTSKDTGKPEVYVAQLPNLAGKQRVSTGGALNPVWGRDGKELFFATNRGLMAADVKAGGEKI